jgi:CheY-like chemotaxis protein
VSGHSITGEAKDQPQFGRARPTPRLLVVDDVVVHRMILCKAAQKAGYATLEAGTVDEAVEVAMANELACITLDLSLGERGGTEVMRRLADLNRRMPVIIISGLEPAMTQAAHDFGAKLGLQMEAPVAKPVDLTKLRDLLLRLEADWLVAHHSFAPVA